MGSWGPGLSQPLSPCPHSLQQGKSSSTGNLLDKEELALPPPDYGTASRAFPAQAAGTFKQRPYSVAVPAFSQVSAAGGAPEAALLKAKVVPLPGLPSGWGIGGLQASHLAGSLGIGEDFVSRSPLPEALGLRQSRSERGHEHLRSSPGMWPEASC